MKYQYLLKSYEKDSAAKAKENELLLEKVNTLIGINKDLIAAKEQEAENNAQQPKVIMEVSKNTINCLTNKIQGSPESEAEFLRVQLTNAALERDVEKYKTLNLKLRQEISLQSDQASC